MLGHVSNVCHVCYYNLRGTLQSPVKGCLNHDTVVMIPKAMVTSGLDYCHASLCHITKGTIIMFVVVTIMVQPDNNKYTGTNEKK